MSNDDDDDATSSTKTNNEIVMYEDYLNVKLIKSLYVHKTILEWFENEILTCHPINSVIVEEIFHNKFDENVKHVVSDRNTEQIVFDRIWMESKYKMRWLADSTYFISVDEYYDAVLNHLQEELQKYDLSKYIRKTYRLEVKWITIQEIHVFEFSIDLDQKELRQISQIFIESIAVDDRHNIDKILPLFLAIPLPWHNYEFDFIDMDTLAMDICAEEWKRYDLLSDLNAEDLLSLELANKDFRVPYYNDYLDRYLENVLNKKLAFSREDGDKIEYSLPLFDKENLIGYFIYKYHNKFSNLYTSQSKCKVNFDYITKLLQISSYEFVYDKTLYLSGEDPDPITLVTRYKGIETIIYLIENYAHFTGELFCELLQMPNHNQLYEFDFNDGFNFVIPVSGIAIPRGQANISIVVYNSSAENEVKLCNFLRYLMQLLKGHNCSAGLLIMNCILSDYTVFENISASFLKIEFHDMQISRADLLLLASYLSNENLLVINFNISDNDVLALLQHSTLEPQNLSIDDYDACTPLIYYMVAELLMERNKVKFICMSKMMTIKAFEFTFNRRKLEFYEENDTIYMRNSETGVQIDLYYFLNCIPLDDGGPPFDYT